MIKYRIGNATYNTNDLNTPDGKFPGGEVGPSLNSERLNGFKVDEITVLAHLPNNDEIMKLLNVVDALRREYGDVKLKAQIPYMPYARQDRVDAGNRGYALGAVPMANLINSLNFSEVVVLDPHSDVMCALIKNIRITTQTDVFKCVHNDWSNIHIVAPDAGAYKKSSMFAKAVGAKGLIVCNKDRDPATGRITDLSMSADVTGLNLFILDDICDGGRTFTELAKLTTEAKRVELAVTHGLFTKGVDVVANEFHAVYTTDSFLGYKPQVKENVRYLKSIV
jgi:ribose-phosphate pyrophosphokinase